MRGVTLALVFSLAASARGQESPANLGLVRLRVVHDTSPVAFAVARSGAMSARTNANGEASFPLRAGARTIVVSRLGFRPESVTVVVAADRIDTVVVRLRQEIAEAERIYVMATRTERRVDDTPLRVEVLVREEIEEKMLMTPGDISMMMNETGGLRVQTTAPALGAANIRVQGLRGRYTLLLSDGLPLHGGQAGALGLLQIPPMDLAQVEVIKGAASALYGPSAMGGVVNLVSRRPREASRRELLVNGTSRGGADLVYWSEQRLSERLAFTLLGGLHGQRAGDVDDDGWIDLPEYRRVVLRPRVFLDGGNGRSAFFTLGATREQRDGGRLAGPVLAAVDEGQATEHHDAGIVVRLPLESSVVSARSAMSSDRHDHTWTNAVNADEHTTGFGELSLATTLGTTMFVLGTALRSDRFRSENQPRLDFDHTIPAGFGQVDVEPLSWLALSASARGDAHSEFGATVNPRVSVLFRGPEGWTARVSGGTGSFAPTPFTEETDAAGLGVLDALGPLSHERGAGGSIDVAGQAGPFEISAAVFGSRTASALIVRPVAGDATRLEIVNSTLPTRTAGADALLRHRAGDLVTTFSYTHVRSTEESPAGGMRRLVPLTPRHSAGLVSVWEQDGVQRIGIEVYYTGRQSLDDNPYRTESKPYVVVGAIAERRFGRTRVFVNLENIGDSRMTRHQPLPRPAPGAGGRLTTDAWGPLEGRTINIGVRLGTLPRQQ